MHQLTNAFFYVGYFINSILFGSNKPDTIICMLSKIKYLKPILPLLEKHNLPGNLLVRFNV